METLVERRLPTEVASAALPSHLRVTGEYVDVGREQGGHQGGITAWTAYVGARFVKSPSDRVSTSSCTSVAIAVVREICTVVRMWLYVRMLCVYRREYYHHFRFCCL